MGQMGTVDRLGGQGEVSPLYKRPPSFAVIFHRFSLPFCAISKRNPHKIAFSRTNSFLALIETGVCV